MNTAVKQSNKMAEMNPKEFEQNLGIDKIPSHKSNYTHDGYFNFLEGDDADLDDSYMDFD